jgi:hypothetical protein
MGKEGKDKGKDKKDKDKKDKDKKGSGSTGGGGAGGFLPTQYHSQKVFYQYASPHQDPRGPFQPPMNLDQQTHQLFLSSSQSFRSVDTDGNGNLSPGEFKSAMQKLNYIVPKAAGAPAKKDKKDKKDKKQKKDAKGNWMELFRVIDKDGGGTVDEREFCEYYVWAQKAGFGVGGGAAAGGPPQVAFRWNKVDGALARISVAGNHVWGVNAEGNIWTMGAHGWTQIPGSASDISVSSDGTVWCVTPTGDIYRWVNNNWTQVPGSLTRVSVAGPNNVWGVNKANEIYNWNGSQWNKIDGMASYVSVGEDGCAWVINAAGEIYRRNGPAGQWERVPGSLASVSVFNATSVVGCNAAGEIWVWTGSNWQQAPGSAKFVGVGANLNASVWAVTPTGEVYRHV